MSDAFAPLYIAYSIAWVGVVIYLFLLHQKQRKLASEMAALRGADDGK
jgi:CcmD family protein